MSLDNTTSNEDSDLQYLVTFERDYHGELVIDQLLSLESPTFNPIQNIHPLHKGYATLPHELQLGIVSPLSLFRLFFTNEQLQLMVENTNTYEQVKGREGGQVWNPLTLNELKIWLGLIIYMGVHHINALDDLWNQDDKRTNHKIKRFISLYRFQQIKRFFHISALGQLHTQWYLKVEPFTSHIQSTVKKYYVPSSQVSIDEMIVHFSGRSIHTVRVKNKPTPERYKIISLCDYSYTWAFVFTSRVKKNDLIESISGLNNIGCLIAHLANVLPNNKMYYIYMNNYFSSIPLFKYLREKGMGACGTIRTNLFRFPKELKIGKKIALDWNTLLEKVINDILAIFWIDNGPVTMLTTIHEIVGENWKVIRNRRQPRKTSFNANTVCRVFGDRHRKELEILWIIDDYNHYMGGVDIADQLREYYNCQLTVRRTWFPLFFWILDTVLVNCVIIYHKVTNSNISSKDFRINLVPQDLQTSSKGKRIVINKKYELPVTRLLGGDHFVEWREKRMACIYCCYLAQHGAKDINSDNPLQTQLWCTNCEVLLCCSKARPTCFRNFHLKDNKN
ncbi:16971_t:CDS:2 [Cetraspora pellucida]|uniref:16971_t:CDS:1 n=1 Tax=Cetraspora pellucida TaxID=1433469 RepID=A0A9N9CUX3_9GLOM|nr:16971_t:CDS:2 [Cetraspora pellucida]